MASNPPYANKPWQEVAERFQFAGIAAWVLGILGWVAWFAPFDDLLDRSGTPIGGDFVMLYVAGQTVASGESSTLYDDQQNQIRSSALFPSMEPSESWPYRYPPTVAACMAPLSCLAFPIAFVVFVLLQCTLLGLGIYLLQKTLPCLRSHWAWMWAVAGCPLVIESLLGGQSSILAFVIAIAAIYFLSRHRDAAAGAVLALALYKPNSLFLFVFACIIVRPRILMGYVPVAFVGVGIAVTTCGWSGLSQYVDLALHLASSAWSFETPYWKVHGLSTCLQAVVPEYGRLLCLLAGLALSMGIALGWRSGRLGPHAAWALLLMANALFNPYVPIYDMTLLIVAFAVAGQASLNCEFPSVSAWQLQLLAGGLFFGPHLSQAICRPSGVQLFPLLLLLLLISVVARLLLVRPARAAELALEH